MTDAVKYGNRWEGHTHCLRCSIPLRPKSRSEAQMPGTRPHLGRGLCRRCYDLDRRGRNHDSLRDEIDFMLSSGDSLDSLHRNPGIAKMAVEFVLKKMGYV